MAALWLQSRSPSAASAAAELAEVVLSPDDQFICCCCRFRRRRHRCCLSFGILTAQVLVPGSVVVPANQVLSGDGQIDDTGVQ